MNKAELILNSVSEADSIHESLDYKQINICSVVSSVLTSTSKGEFKKLSSDDLKIINDNLKNASIALNKIGTILVDVVDENLANKLHKIL